MAETPPPSHPPPPPPPSPPPSSPPQAPLQTASDNLDSTQYWCYQCDKRVPVETRPDQPDVVCFECKNGFVESIAREIIDDESSDLGNEFLQVLRLIAQATRDDDAPPPPPLDRAADDSDYFRIELDGWDNEEEDEENHNLEDRDRDGSDDVDVDDDDDEDEEDIENRNDDEDDDEEEVLRRRHRRDVLRLRLRDFANRALSRHNRVLDWAEILMGLEDHSVDFRLQVLGDVDGYVGNPGDYVDAAGYEALLQNLAENDSSGRRGAPPAAKSAIEALQTVEVNSTNIEVCAICKDKVFDKEEKIAKQLPCGHMYHGECIVPWLGSRNTCPVCRYELPTDDPEYEEDRKKRSIAITTTASTTIDHGCSSSSGGGV